MTKELADLLTEDMGEIRDDYSGRGMYGTQTYAVSFDSESDFRTSALSAAFALGEQAETDDDVYDHLEALKLLRMDSMGLGIVVY